MLKCRLMALKCLLTALKCRLLMPKCLLMALKCRLSMPKSLLMVLKCRLVATKRMLVFAGSNHNIRQALHDRRNYRFFRLKAVAPPLSA